MKSKQRKFNVDFFTTIEIIEQENNSVVYNPISIKSLLEDLCKEPKKNRFKQINGEKILLQDIKKLSRDDLESYENLNECEGLWEIVFIKYKDSEVFGIANTDGEYDEEKLEKILKSENERNYIASPTICVYDENKDIFIIVRNKEAASSSNILEFLKVFSKNRNMDFHYIPTENDLLLNKNTIIKNIEISIGNLMSMSKTFEKHMENNTPGIFNIISEFKNIGCNNARFSATMGKSKGKKNNEIIKEQGIKIDTAKEMLFLSRENYEYITNLKIGVKFTNKNKIEKIDLINDRLTDQFKISYNTDDRIKSNNILKKLLSSYNDKYENIHTRGVCCEKETN